MFSKTEMSEVLTEIVLLTIGTLVQPVIIHASLGLISEFHLKAAHSPNMSKQYKRSFSIDIFISKCYV